MQKVNLNKINKKNSIFNANGETAYCANKWIIPAYVYTLNIAIYCAFEKILNLDRAHYLARLIYFFFKMFIARTLI